jgi:transposase
LKNEESHKFVFLDESGIDDDEVVQYGWSPKGERLYASKPAFKKKRMSIIGALNQGCFQAPFVFEGSCDRIVFEFFLQKVLSPILKKNQIIIMDNASFHKGGRIEQIINAAGCQLLYLPPYSPDLNPIEHHWWPIKNNIRSFLPKCDRDLFFAAQKVFGGVS